MVFQLAQPCARVASVVTHYIYFADVPLTHSFDRFLPNGQVDLVIDLREAPKDISDNATLRPLQTVAEAWISGTRTRAITIPSGQGAEHFIVQFRPGFSACLFGFALTEVTDRVVQCADILPWISRELRPRLQEASTPREKFAVADRVLSLALKETTVHPVIQAVVPRLAANPSLWNSAALENLTGYTSRYVAEQFKQHLGLRPKSWMRLLRFQRSLRALGRGLPAAEVALACGYYDQSHFTADFQEFSGLTPRTYVDRKGEDLYYVPAG